MRETFSSTFSREELRDLNRITKDPEKHLQFANVACSLYRSLEENPESKPEEILCKTQQVGYQLLLNSIDRFRSSRQAVTYWKKHVHDSDANERIRTILDIPSEIAIHGFQFLPDTIGIVMPSDDLNTLDNYYEKKLGIQPFLSTRTRGFVNTDTRLADGEGNVSHVIFIAQNDPDEEKLVAHERAHSGFNTYYLRLEHTSNHKNEQQMDFSQATKKYLKDSLTKGEDAEEVLSLVFAHMHGVIVNKRELFWNEMVATAAEYAVSKDLPTGFFDDVGKSLEYYNNVSIHVDYDYASILLQEVNGVNDFIEDTMLSDDKKVSLSLFVEHLLADFHKQNNVITSWVERLAQQSNRKDLPVKLMTVPLNRLWSIGNLTGDDPKEFEKSLLLPAPYAKAVWPVLIRYANSILDDIMGDAELAALSKPNPFDEEMAYVEKDLFLWKMTRKLTEFIDENSLAEQNPHIHDLSFELARQLYEHWY